MLDFIKNLDGSMIASESAANGEVESLVQKTVDNGIIREGFQYDAYNIHSKLSVGTVTMRLTTSRCHSKAG